MIDFSAVRTIFWDFDGVIMDSMSVRDQGFEKVLADYDPQAVRQLMAYHHANGGLSRYVKFRYFFEQILMEEVSEAKLAGLARHFTAIMREELPDTKYLIAQTVAFIEKFSRRFIMDIVSGSDQEELRYLCHEVGIAHHFHSINGSPTPKIQLVAKLMEQQPQKRVILIGDSPNDLEAAQKNGIAFYGFNNKILKDRGEGYIENFDQITTSP